MASLSTSDNNLTSSSITTQSFDSLTTSSKNDVLSSQAKNDKTNSHTTVTSTASNTTSKFKNASSATHAAMGENNAQIGGIRLAQFIQNIDDYTPTIPDDVTTYHLNRAGFDTTDPRVIRLISLTSQKFVSDIVGDAMQQCKMRSSSQNNKKGAKDKQYCLTMEDLAAAANEYGIHIKKPHYFS